MGALGHIYVELYHIGTCLLLSIHLYMSLKHGDQKNKHYLQAINIITNFEQA